MIGTATGAATGLATSVLAPDFRPEIADGKMWIPDIAVPIAFDETAEHHGWHLHDGCRLAIMAHRGDPSKVIVFALGGPTADPGYDEGGVAFGIGATGLRRLAADFIAAADLLDPAGAR